MILFWDIVVEGGGVRLMLPFLWGVFVNGGTVQFILIGLLFARAGIAHCLILLLLLFATVAIVHLLISWCSNLSFII